MEPKHRKTFREGLELDRLIEQKTLELIESNRRLQLAIAFHLMECPLTNQKNKSTI